MTDSRLTRLAKILVTYSVAVRAGDKVLISVNPAAWPLGKEVYKLTLKLGAFPHLVYAPGELDYFFYQNASHQQLTRKPEVALMLANWADKFIRLYSAKNNSQLATIDPKRLMVHSKATVPPVQKVMLSKPWVLTEFPSESMAQTASMSLDELEDIYFKACLKDWAKTKRGLNRIKKKLDGAKVTLIGQDTNLTMSFKGRLFAPCAGNYNMPDGEIFSAPVTTSVSGKIYFDLPSLRSGHVVEGVYLEFKAGRVVKARASRGQNYLKAALATDKGASHVGELGIGTNFGIKKAMLNTLFDEKIGGTIHMALGNSYPDKNGGGTNRSALHWDIVKDMRLKGSQILANGKAILKEGKFL